MLLNKNPGSALVDNLRSNVGTQTQSQLANMIGDARLSGQISHPEQLGLHAAAGATGALIKNTDPWSAMVAAPTSEALFDKLYLGGMDLKTAADISKIAGSTTGLLTGNVDSASSSASTTIDNNSVPHVAAATAACAVNPVCAGIVATATIAAGVVYYSMPQDERNAMAQRAAYYVQTQLNAGMDIEQIKNSIPGFAPAPKLQPSLETPIHQEKPKVLATLAIDQKPITKLETPIYEQDQSEYLEGFTAAPDWLKNFGAVLLSERPDTVEKIAGHYPRNSKYAGKTFPIDKLPSEIRGKYPDSVKFNEKGFPDFTPYAIKSVKLDNLQGNRSTDYSDANKAAGIQYTTKGYTWHHVEDGKTMVLIPTDIHNAVRHTGGCSILNKKGC